MSEFVQSLFFAFLGAGISAAGFFAKRHFERNESDAVDRFLERHKELLAVHNRTSGQARPVTTIDKAIQVSPVARVALNQLLVDRAVPLTQSEMNSAAAEEFATADHLLNLIVDELMLRLDERARREFLAAQKAWEEHRDLEAGAAASPNEGGTIWSSIFNSHRAGLTRQRSRELQSWLEATNL
jgi:uncharacterized protein YecT (DUF1311 family)